MPEGFWQTSTATKAEGWPVDTNDWCHLMSVTHSNDQNYHALQLAGAYSDNENFFIRKVAGDINAGYGAKWRKLVTDQTLGADVGIKWSTFQQRVLVEKSQAQGDSQPAIDIQVNAGPGVLNASGTGVSSSLSVVGRAMPDTKHGHFTLVAKLENYATYADGEPEAGHVAQASYVDQHSVWSTPGWAIAAEVKEIHGEANPRFGSLAAELTVIANGTDDFDKRCMLFLPANSKDGGYAEFAQGIYWKTDIGQEVYKNAMFLQGEYWNILNADAVKAQRLIKATGNFSGPVIDLGFVTEAGENTALKMNVAHQISWTTADHIVAQRLGRLGDTMFIDGLPWNGTAGPQVGFVTIVLNGTRLRVPCHLES
ncbi:hypothetical protein [Methylobacterium indicum]|uniref:hypothetical protein n=1 Tax=Methylobacterium indicum TaxID=1775910 RepID=UPI001A913B6A|nr:hypothetical protein [Methylobacterium indicum]